MAGRTSVGVRVRGQVEVVKVVGGAGGQAPTYSRGISFRGTRGARGLVSRGFRIATVLLVVVTVPVAARTVTDSAGRVVDVPSVVKRVFAAGPPAMVLVYVLRPQVLVGWPRRPDPEMLPYIAEPFRTLPETGRLSGRGGEANLEAVLNAAPDLIVDFGSLRATYASLADRVQTQTGIPYVLIDGRFDNTAAALRLMGQVLGVSERGEKLARYAEATFSELDATLASLPLEHRPRVYLARGSDGLETGLQGSINTEIIERAGGRNVAGAGDRRQGLVRMSMEQVIAIDPDTIITWDENFYSRVWTDPLWSAVRAVREGRVLRSPLAPFGWIDRPPSLNRLIGLKWLANTFYPERFPLDMRQTVREFYRLFYHVELSDEDLDRLML